MRAHKSSSRVGGTEEDGDEDEDALARARALEVGSRVNDFDPHDLRLRLPDAAAALEREEDARAMVEDLLLGPAGRKLGDVNAIFTLDNTGRSGPRSGIQLEDLPKMADWLPEHFRRLVVSESDCITQVSFIFF